MYLFQGRLDEALPQIEKANRLDPMNIAFKRNLALIHFNLGNLQEAEEILLRTIKIDPFLPGLHSYLGFLYLKQGRNEEALDMMKQDSIAGVISELQIGIVYAWMGRTDDALKILDKWRKRSENEYVSAYRMAALCFSLGITDEGFSWLEEGFAKNDGWMINVKIDFLMDPVRDDPRYRALLKKMNLF
jgi:tetratricopeptide (TPR) repeat protein